MNSRAEEVFIQVFIRGVFLLFFWLIVDQGLRINVKTLDRCYNSLLV